MATKKKMLQAAAGSAGGAALDITDVFSTYLYTGTGAAQTITNGIDLDGEGGLLWIKKRSGSANHYLSTNETGGGWLYSNQTNGIVSSGNTTTFEFQSNGFINAATGTNTNGSGEDYASWTFRKAPKFFTCLTYTGTGSTQNISHDLGSVPGMIVAKRTDSTGSWITYHRSLGNDKYLLLQDTNASATGTAIWDSTTPTDSVFTVGALSGLNLSGATYVAYLFAHNDGDGDFGPDGDADIIKCGSYTGNGNDDGPEINLGFEPQWVMVKNTTDADSWYIFDVMRGMVVAGTDDAALRADSSLAETGTSGERAISPTPTGFKVTTNQGWINNNNSNLIYIAIRRGPLAQPESGTEVFNTTLDTTNALTTYDIGFPVDMMISSYTGVVTTGNRVINSRLQGFGYVDTDTVRSLFTYGNDSEQTLKTALSWDNNTGFTIPDEYKSGSESVHWSWKRAPGFCDVVAYTGDGVAGRTVSHNLGVAPEMMWIKSRNNARGWRVYHSSFTNGSVSLNSAASKDTSTNYFSTPTAVNIILGTDNDTNRTAYTYIAYLFASLDGISKVGSYTGNNSSQTIDCGFTSGARFVLIKCSNDTGDWYIWDTQRGIVSGNDSFLILSEAGVENTQSDDIDPQSTGFIVNHANAGINESGKSYIFYAIA